MYDFLNTPITQGSFISYPRRQGSRMWMQVGKVTQVDEQTKTLKVVADTGEYLSKVTIRKPEHVTVLHPSQLETAGYTLSDFDSFQ